MKRSLSRRMCVVLALAVTLPGFAPTVARAAEDVLRTPLAVSPVKTGVIAASGQSLLAYATSAQLSTDRGKTWEPAAFEDRDDLWLDSVHSTKAVLTDYGQLVDVFDLATNRNVEYSVPDEVGEVFGASATVALTGLWDDGINGYWYSAIDLATGEVTELLDDWFDDWPSGYDSNDQSLIYGIVGEQGAVLQTNYIYDNVQVATDIDPLLLDGGMGGDIFRVKGYVPYVGIVGDRVEYVKRVDKAVSVCSRPLDGIGETCALVATLGSASHSVMADRSGAAIRLELNGVEYLWENSQLTRASYVGSSAVWTGIGNPDRPLLRVSATSSGSIQEVAADGASTKLFDDFGDPISPDDLDLAADRVAGVDKRLSAWSRSLSADAIGPESVFGAHTSTVVLTSGRTVVKGETGLTFYDRGTKKSTFATTGSLVDASGPYALVSVAGKGSIRTSSGAVAATNPVGIFGSRYVGLATNGHDALVKDVVSGQTLATIDTSSLTGTWNPDLTRIWGDWISCDLDTGLTMPNDEPITDAHVYDLSTGIRRTYEGGSVVSLGDGVAVVYDRTTQRYVLWTILTNDRATLADDVRQPVMDDGNRVAYAEGGDLVVKTVSGAGASAPRLLGTVAPASFNPNAGAWKPEFDTTKALAEGTLEISHGTGLDLVVDRELTVPASSDGSIRGVSWDGKNTAGEWLADGAYTWTLKTTDAADPDKDLVAIDGTSAASGTVTVKTANLGTATGPTPKISDTTPTVDQTLTVTAGTWTPSNVQFAYQWYRGATAIPDATTGTYKVQAADAGQALKVKVTGSCPGTDSLCRGYATAAKTSAATSSVAKATISQAPVPTLNVTTPTVEKPILATIGLWGPNPVGLEFGWYRVSSTGKATAIKGADEVVYSPTGSDVGYRLKFRVTGTKSGYTTKSVYSALTGKVAKAAFAVVEDPVVIGSLKAGMTLTALPGATDQPATFTYQWYRGTSTISGATAATYRTTSTDLGKQIRVRVTYKRSGYVSVSRYSAFTGAIESGIIAVTPKLDDTTPVVGQVLKITDATSIGSWNPSDATAAYQWYRDTTAIPGATEATYEVQSADVGKAIKVKVTGSKDGYASVAKTSAASSDVAKGTFTTKPVPTIEGELTVGSTLTAVHGDWSPAPTSFTYAWYRSGTAITGQAASTYTVVAADAGRTITVKVTAVRSGFTSASATSAGVLIPA